MPPEEISPASYEWLLSDTELNHRFDGTIDGLYFFGPTSTHNGVTYPDSAAMTWVANTFRAAYGW